MVKRKQERYEIIASDIYDLIADEHNRYGDIIAGLELARLWIFRDYMESQICECEDSNVDTIEVSKSTGKAKSNRVTPKPGDLGSEWSEEE